LPSREKGGEILIQTAPLWFRERFEKQEKVRVNRGRLSLERSDGKRGCRKRTGS